MLIPINLTTVESQVDVKRTVAVDSLVWAVVGNSRVQYAVAGGALEALLVVHEPARVNLQSLHCLQYNRV